MADRPTAAFLIIGNEILSGRTHEGNLPVLAKALGARGIDVAEVRVVRDDENAIVSALHALREQVDYVFTSGGLGPTHDDITSDSIAKAFGVEVVRHPEAMRVLGAHYERLELPFNDARQTMADVPDGATLVPNRISAAPGFQIGNVYAFAGVPNIFEAMLDEVLPTLVSGVPVVSRSLYTGLPEGVVANPLRDLQAAHPEVDIGSYPRFANKRWATTIVMRSPEPAAVDAAFDAVHALTVELGGTPREEET